jgi:hypothetical protein
MVWVGSAAHGDAFITALRPVHGGAAENAN